MTVSIVDKIKANALAGAAFYRNPPHTISFDRFCKDRVAVVGQMIEFPEGNRLRFDKIPGTGPTKGLVLTDVTPPGAKQASRLDIAQKLARNGFYLFPVDDPTK